MERKITVYAIIIVILVASTGYMYNARTGLLRTIQEMEGEISELYEQKGELTEQKGELTAQIGELTAQIGELTAQIGELTESVKIGMLVNDIKTLSLMQVVAWIAEDEINQYCEENGYQYRFEFILETTDGQIAVALENVQSFKAMGIDLVVAYLGTEYNVLQSYVSDHSMVFIDALNTMPEFALPDDGLYRMRPIWTMQGFALAENMWSWGNEAAIILRQDSPYMDEIYDVFTDRYETKGGNVFAETYLPDPEVTELSTFFLWLETAIQAASAQYGECGVGIQLFTFSDIISLFPLFQAYPTALDVFWFGNEALANHPSLFMYHPTIADRIKIMSPSPAIAVDTDMYQDFATAYTSSYSVVPSFEACLIYDSCWVMAKSVINAGSSDGDQVNPVVITTSNSHTGTTSRCALDINGDRVMMDFDIWGYSVELEGFTAVKYGYYSGETDTTTWFTELPGPCCWLSGSNSLFAADFEDDTVGSPPAPTAPLQYGPSGAGLEIVGDPDAVLVVDSTALGPKAMRMRRSYGSETRVKALVGDIGDMPYTSGVAYIEFSAHCEEFSEPEISRMSISIRSEGGQAALLMSFYDGVYHIHEGETDISIMGSYDPNAAHSIRIKLDLDTQWYWICINGEIVADRAFASGGFTELHSLEFHLCQAILEAFPMVYVVDDIRITK